MNTNLSIAVELVDLCNTNNVNLLVRTIRSPIVWTCEPLLSKREDVARKIGMALSSTAKAAILFSLEDGAKTFTEMLRQTKSTHGALYYHLLVLDKEGLLAKQGQRYFLSPLGQKVAKTAMQAWKASEEIA